MPLFVPHMKTGAVKENQPVSLAEQVELVKFFQGMQLNSFVAGPQQKLVRIGIVGINTVLKPRDVNPALMPTAWLNVCAKANKGNKASNSSSPFFITLVLMINIA